MGLLICMCGNPASGKSTVAQKIFDEVMPNSYVVSTDAIRKLITGSEARQDANALVFQKVDEMLNNLKNEDVIYDATNTIKSQRKYFCKKWRKCYEVMLLIWVDTDIMESLNRNLKRERQVPKEVIIKMWQRLQDNPPTIAEGWDEVYRVKSDEDLDKIIEDIKGSYLW